MNVRSTHHHDHGFKKSLKLFDATTLVMGSMIGSGIFIVSASMSRDLGAPGWVIAAWVIAGIMTIFAALSYGELAAMMPNAGGQYVYLKEAYGPLSGFLFGWTMFLVIQTGTIAAVAMAFGKYTGEIFPWFSEKHLLLDWKYFKFSTTELLAIAMIVLLTYLNTRGIRSGKIIQNIFTSSKVFILLAIIVFGLFVTQNIDAIKYNMSIFWDARGTSGGTLSGMALLAALGTAMVGSLFSSDAWNNVTFTAGEVINPKKDVPLSLFIGTLSVTILYILANLAYMCALPLRGTPEAVTVAERGMQFAVNDRLAGAAMNGLFGETAAIIVAAFVMISTFGCNNGLILSGARVYFAMAHDRLFFNKASQLNSKGVPAVSLIVQGVWASLLCLSGTYSDLLDYVIFAVLIFYALTITGIFVLRRNRPDAERPYKAFGYPVIPVIYIVMAAAILTDLLIYRQTYSLRGLIIVISGIPVYYLWKHFNRHKSS